MPQHPLRTEQAAGRAVPAGRNWLPVDSPQAHRGLRAEGERLFSDVQKHKAAH